MVMVCLIIKCSAYISQLQPSRKTHSAGSEVLSAGSEALSAGSEALSAGSEGLPAGSEKISYVVVPQVIVPMCVALTAVTKHLRAKGITDHTHDFFCVLTCWEQNYLWHHLFSGLFPQCKCHLLILGLLLVLHHRLRFPLSFLNCKK